MQKGLLAYRWLTLAWAVAVFTGLHLTRRGGSDAVARPVIGYLLLGLAVAVTAALTLQLRRDPDRLLQPGPVLGEIAVATLLLTTDAWVHGSIEHPNTVPSIWVVGAVGSATVAAGRRAGVTTGLGLGLARLVGLWSYTNPGRALFTGASTMILLALTGWIMGYLLQRLAEADRSISAYRAREEVARTLHDGVLQTLAVIQRRSTDTELVSLARSQELELRDYLFGSPASAAGGAPGRDLAGGLRAAARRAEDRYGLVVQVAVAPDLPPTPERTVSHLVGAVTEALTNAAKHGGAATATVYAEPADGGGLFLSVKDDGCGFDPATVAEGQGLTRSIRGRLSEIGGRVEVDGRPGRGAEIRLHVP